VSYTAIKLTDGTSVIASNTVKDTGGTDHAVLDNVMAADTSLFAVFGATVLTTIAKIVTFRLFDNRIFKL
jgi:hypothetical protein